MIRLVAILGVLAISFAAIFVRLAGASPNTTAIFRGLYALPVLLALWLPIRHDDHRPARLRWVAFGAGLLLALDFTFWHRGIEHIGAGLATVLVNTQVVFVALIAWAFHGERPTRAAAVVIPVVFAGVVLVSGVGQQEAYGDAPVLGGLFSTLAGMAYAGYIVVFRSSNRMRAHPAGPMLDATLGMTAGSLVLGITDPGLSLVPHWPTHAWLAILGIGPHTVGWLCLGIALPRLATLETSVLILLQPMGTVAWGWLIFGEVLGPVQWLGAALVLGGVTALSVWRPAPSPSSTAAAGTEAS